jgi:predicted PurR-regulated permease PerM
MVFDPRPDASFVRGAFVIALVFTLTAVAGWITLPFIGALTWGAIIAISVYPLHLRLMAKIGGLRKLSAILIGIFIALVLFAPLVLLFLSIGDHAKQAVEALMNVKNLSLPDLPVWIAELPLVGSRIAKAWQHAQADLAGTIESIRPQLRAALLATISHIVASSVTLIEAALAIIASTVFLITGPQIKMFFVRLLEKLGAPDSVLLVLIIERTVHAVSQGIIGTALIQAALLWAGYAIAGAPFPIFLAFLALVLCSIQLGVMIIGLPVAAWMWSQGDTGWAGFVLGWTIFVNVVDNFIKPVLIGRDFPVPLWVGFIGVIGGLLAMGLIGLFIGPIVLAIFYRLLIGWTYAETLPKRQA